MLGVRLAIALVAGGGDTLLDTATMVGSLNYMRGDEEAADRGAVEWLVRARIDPVALSTAFERLAEETPDMPGAFRYLSTHPPLSQRRTEAIAAARKAKSQGVIEWLPALSPVMWRQLRAGCMCSED
jgi:predicted Zn-dependent protease